MIFVLLTLIVCVYAYALFNRLPLDEQRKNITIYDVNGDIIYESNFKKICNGHPLTTFPNLFRMLL